MSDATRVATIRDFTIEEEWREIILLQAHLVDRLDRLVVRAGCKNRQELMNRLANGARLSGRTA